LIKGIGLACHVLCARKIKEMGEDVIVIVAEALVYVFIQQGEKKRV